MKPNIPNTVQGCDVSHHNGVFNWTNAKKSGFEFAFVKATEGATNKDPMFDHNYQAASDAGMLVGAYHFFHPSQDAMAQAKHFCDTVKTCQGKLPPVLDWEISDTVSTSHQISKAGLILGVIEDNLGKTPLIYGNRSFLLGLKLPYQFTRYGLWLAEYAPQYVVPAPWLKNEIKFWQWTDGGESHLDQNLFFGSIDDLKKLAS